MAKTFVQQPPLPLEIDQGDAGTAAFYVVELVFLDEWLVVEEGVDLTAQGTAALAVDDLDRAEAGSQGLVEEAFDFRQGLAECLADDVQFRGHAGRADRPVRRGGSGFLFGLLFFLQFVQVRRTDVLEFDADRHAPDGDGQLFAADVFDRADAVQVVDEDLLADFQFRQVDRVALGLFRFRQGNLLDSPAGLVDGLGLFPVRPLLGLGLQFADNLFGFDAEVALEVDGIAAAGVDDILPLRRDLVLFFAQIIFQFPGFAQAVFQFRLFFVHLFGLCIELGQDFFHIHVLSLAAQVFGFFQDIPGHTQAFADAESVGTAGRADAQLVRRLQRFHIELDVAVFDARRIIGIVLEVVVMGRDHDIRAFLVKGIEDGNGDGTAFGRVRTGTEFVCQDEVFRPAVLEDVDKLLHMAGKGTQVLGNILFVADVGKDVAEDGQFRRFTDGDEQAGLMHEDQKAQGLHGNGLAARVGACNEQDAVIAADDDGIGHDVLGVDEGMAGLDEPDFPRLGNGRTAGLHLQGQLSLGKGEFQLTDTLRAVIQVIVLLLHFGRQAAENAFDFLRFANAGGLQVVVGIDDGQRFDIERRATGRRIMDNAGKGMAVFLLDGDDIAVVAHCDQGILEILLVFLVLQDIIDITLGLPFQFDDTAAQAHQFRRRIVADLAVVVKDSGERMRKLGKIANDLCLFGQLGILSPPFGEERPDFPIMLEVIPDIDTFMGIEGHFALGLFQGRTDIDDAAEGRARFRLHAADGFFRIGQVLFNDIAIVHRSQAAGDFFRQPGRGQADQHVLDLVESQNPHTSFIHKWHYSCCYKIPWKK